MFVQMKDGEKSRLLVDPDAFQEVDTHRAMVDRLSGPSLLLRRMQTTSRPSHQITVPQPIYQPVQT
jgi:hypothetical protein